MSFDEPEQLREPTPEEDRLAYEVIGAAIEVHRVLGPGLFESIYEQALCIELNERKIPFVRQMEVDLRYKGQPVGKARLDLLVGGSVVLELKSVERLSDIHTAQVITYLSAAGFVLGLLINFNAKVLKDGIKRIVCSKSR
jgi:GxxExxY protein